MSVGSVLASLAPGAGDIIKSNTAFAVFDPDTAIGWVGTLTTLSNTSGYKIKLSEPGTVLHEGTPVDPGATPVPIANGWNWIGYLPAQPMSVATALGDLEARGLLNGDEIVKGLSLFAEWNSGWFGSLETMSPGEGYKLYLQDPALPSSFNYPGGSPAFVAGGLDEAREGQARAPAPPLTRSEVCGRRARVVVRSRPLRAQHDAHRARRGRRSGLRNAENVVGAFVGDECRGVGPLLYVRGVGGHLAFVTIHGNQLEGETIAFRAYHAASGATYDVVETLPWTADAPAGAIRAPIVLSAVAGGNSLPVVFALSPAYPKPRSGRRRPFASTYRSPAA